MVGCGLVMLFLAWVGTYLNFKERLECNRLLLWAIFLSCPLPFIAILTGWFTAEVGRQPWTVYGVLRTSDSVTPFLTAGAAMVSLLVFCSLYGSFSFSATYYVHRLLRIGPVDRLVQPPVDAVPKPSDVGGRRAARDARIRRLQER